MLETNRDFYNGYQAGLRANGVQPTPDAGDIVYDPDGEYDNGTVGKAIQSMDAGDVAYDSSEEYAAGTVGEALSDVKSEISDLAPSIYGNYAQKSIAKTAIASFDDGADNVPLKALEVEIEPVQDLHGYDNPWPGGGGANKLPPAKQEHVIGLNGVTVSFTDDGAITLNGTQTGSVALIKVPLDTPLPVATYAMSWFNATAQSGLEFSLRDADTNSVGMWNTTSSSANKTYSNVTDAEAYYWQLQINNNASFSNFKITPMMVVGSTAATSYAPFSNICPITGFSSVGVTRTGRNVWDEEILNGYYDSTGNFISQSSTVCSKNPMKVHGGESYYCYSGAKNVSTAYYDGAMRYISQGYHIQNSVFTVPANAVWMHLFTDYGSGGTYGNDISINYPSTDTSYHPSSILSLSIPLGSTVYGGTLDVVAGVLTVDRAMVDLGYGTYNKYTAWGSDHTFVTDIIADTVDVGRWSDVCICEMYKKGTHDAVLSGTETGFVMRADNKTILISDQGNNSNASAFKTAMLGVHFVYPISPQTIQLDPANLTTALGANNIFADSGDIELTYRVEPTAFPDAPSEDGTYLLKVTISDGVATYSWEAES